MSIMHPPVDANSDEAFVFAELGGFTCSICAPVTWDVGKVVAFAEEKFPSEGERWVSVDTADMFPGIKGHTPNPCNGAPELRKHWFMMRGYTGD